MDATELYRLPPEQFTAARDAAARQARTDGDAAGAASLKALRRPSVAAWLVNRLAAEDTGLLDELLSLGPALADAQAAGSGAVLRELGAQRRQLVGAVTDRAVALADRSVPAAVRAEVAGTLEAALADAGSADAVRSGRLVRALSYAGFGPVDLSGAVAQRTSGDRGPRGGAGRQAAPAASRAAEVATAEAAALSAAGALDDAVRRCERLAAAAEQAAQAAAEAEQDRDRARQALEAAERAVRDADERRRAAELESRQAVDRVRSAQAAEEQARAALDRLRRQPD